MTLKQTPISRPSVIELIISYMEMIDHATVA